MFGKFVIWWGINTVSLFVVAELLPNVKQEEGVIPLLVVALLIGVINAALRPILYIASCGLIIMTLGLIIPVLNALLLLLADKIAGEAFEIDGFLTALIAAIIMGIINTILGSFFKSDETEKARYARSIE